jgi:hypothetical protein
LDYDGVAFDFPAAKKAMTSACAHIGVANKPYGVYESESDLCVIPEFHVPILQFESDGDGSNPYPGPNPYSGSIDPIEIDRLQNTGQWVELIPTLLSSLNRKVLKNNPLNDDRNGDIFNSDIDYLSTSFFLLAKNIRLFHHLASKEMFKRSVSLITDFLEDLRDRGDGGDGYSGVYDGYCYDDNDGGDDDNGGSVSDGGDDSDCEGDGGCMDGCIGGIVDGSDADCIGKNNDDNNNNSSIYDNDIDELIEENLEFETFSSMYICIRINAYV